jgi:hypothetical protein
LDHVVRTADDGHGLTGFGNSEPSTVCEDIQSYDFVTNRIDSDLLGTLDFLSSRARWMRDPIPVRSWIESQLRGSYLCLDLRTHAHDIQIVKSKSKRYRIYPFTDQLISQCSFYIGPLLKFIWSFSDWKVLLEYAA